MEKDLFAWFILTFDDCLLHWTQQPGGATASLKSTHLHEKFSLGLGLYAKSTQPKL